MTDIVLHEHRKQLTQTHDVLVKREDVYLHILAYAIHPKESAHTTITWMRAEGWVTAKIL